MSNTPDYEYNGIGRPRGSRNKRNEEIFLRLEERGDKDPADFLSELVSNEQESKELRVQAANFLMPYKYSKRGALPPARFIESLEIDVKEFSHVSQAEAFLAKIAILTAQGQIDIQSAQELSALVKTWIDTQYDRENLQLKISPPETHDQKIVISGGLPALPGTNVTMPVLNGHAVSEQLLSAPTDVVPSTNPVPHTAVNEFSPSTNQVPSPGELKAQGPFPLKREHFTPDGYVSD
ncbi:MAG: hypothetical protein C5B54_04145, partial [Acidobacteria bacterium]